MIGSNLGWIPCASSNVEGFRWLSPAEFPELGDEPRLQVKFLDKGYGSSIYEYYNVDEETYDEFFSASSKGKFVWEVLRIFFEYDCIQGPPHLLMAGRRIG